MSSQRRHERRKPVRRRILERAGSVALLPSTSALPLILALAVCLGLRIAASFMPSNWVWGFDALGYLPPALTIVLVGLAIAGFIPAVARTMETALDAMGGAWLRRPVLTVACVSAATGLLLYALRDPVRFVGDSDVRLGLITSGIPSARLFPQAFPLDLLVNAQLARSLVSLGWSAEHALQVLGGLLGALYTAVCLAFLMAAGVRGSALPACAILLLGSGCLLLFPGYGKFGPLLVGIALAALGAVQLSRSPRGAWTLAAGAAISVLSHRTGYLVVLPALLAFGWAFRDLKYRPHRVTLVAAAITTSIVAAAMLPRAIDLFLHFDLAVHLGEAASPVAHGFEATVLSRLSDAVNALFLLTPVWPLGIAAAHLVRRRAQGGDLARFSLAPIAAVAVGLQLVLMLATQSQQGAARDWDIHAGVGATLGFCTCYLLARVAEQADSRKLWAPLSTTALAIAISAWSITTNEVLQLHRIRNLLESRPQWRAEQRARALDFLGWRDFNLGRFKDSAELFERALAAAPNPRYFYQAGLARWRAGQLESAQELALEAARLAPDKADPWWLLAAVARAAGDSASAAARLDSAYARGSRRPPPGL